MADQLLLVLLGTLSRKGACDEIGDGEDRMKGVLDNDAIVLAMLSIIMSSKSTDVQL